MKGGGKHATLPDGDRRAVGVAGQHLGHRADVGDEGRADEDAVERIVAQGRDVEIRLEGVELPPVAVAAHLDVDEGKDRLVAIRDAVGKQDHAGTGPEQRRPGACQRQDRITESVDVDQLAHGRRLAPRQDQRVEVDEIARQADLDRLGADVANRGQVLADVTLQREHADARSAWLSGHAGARYQPRTARRSSTGSSPTEVPRIGSPSPALTSARISGLSYWVTALTMALA